MAEFAEVMRQARRMCKEQQNIDCCVRCPINKNGCMVVADAEYVDYADAEQEIMHWAAEHPEPVYPTWEDGWKQLFPEAKYVPCPDGYFGVDSHCGRYDGCNQCKASPMPADIAKKLGIKPKEGM